MTTEELERRIRAEGLPITPSGFLREKPAAKVLDIAARTLRQWRKDGNGPAWHRLNGSVRFHVADLAAFITSRRHEPPSS